MPKKLYEILGVPEDASEEDIKKAYRKAAREAHPDKGGSTELMVIVNQAGETLKDRVKRAHYDKTGENGQPAEKSPDEQAMEEASAAFSEVCSHLKDEDDHVSALVQVLIDTLAMLEKQIAEIQVSDRALRKRRKYLRYRRKRSGRNFLLDSIDSILSGFPDQIAQRRARMQRIQRALELLKDYGWEPDPDAMHIHADASVFSTPPGF